MATPNIVPRAADEGGLGTSSKNWGKVYTKQRVMEVSSTTDGDHHGDVVYFGSGTVVIG